MNPIYETMDFDAHNVEITKRQLSNRAILQLLERIPGLFEALEAEIRGHLRLETLPYLKRRSAENKASADFTFQFCIFMWQLAKNQFLYAMGHLLRGHTVEVFSHLRSMIECSGYARLATVETDLAELYLDDDTKRFRNRTPSKKMFPDSNVRTNEMKRLYDSCSEMTHNNFRALVARHKLSYETNDGKPEFMSAVLFHDADNENLIFVVQRALYVALISHRVLCLFTEVFELPDSVIHRRLDHFEIDRLAIVETFKKEFGV